MKDLLFSLLLISIFAFTSCSSDDEDPISTVVGTWEISAFIATCSMANMSINEQAQNGCVVIDGDELCFSMTFQENGVGSFSTTFDGDGDISSFTYTINGSEVNICDDSDCNIAILDGGQLTLELIEEGCDVEYVFTKG